jgi:hypothetical protein
VKTQEKCWSPYVRMIYDFLLSGLWKKLAMKLEIFSWVGQHSAGGEGAPKRSLVVRWFYFVLPVCCLIKECSSPRALDQLLYKSFSHLG